MSVSELYGSNELKRCLLICGVVGTILVSINQGPAFFLAPRADLSVLARVVLNYVVPFSVASISAMTANRAHRKTSPQD